MAFTLQLLRNELDADSLGIGYSGMTDGEAEAALNGASRGRPVARQSVDANEIIDALDGGEFASLTTADIAKLQLVLGREVVKIVGGNVRAILLGILSGPSFATSRSNLATLQTSPGSRAAELWGEGFRVTASQIADAKRLP